MNRTGVCARCGASGARVDLRWACTTCGRFCTECAPGRAPVCPTCARPFAGAEAGPRGSHPPRPARGVLFRPGGEASRPAGDVGSSEARWTVRRAGVADLPALVRLFDLYRQFYRQPSDEAGCRTFLRERLRRSESRVYLARQDGVPVGFMQLYPTYSSIALKRLWILNDLYVLPESRGAGVGRRLLLEAQGLARRTNAEGVILDTAVDNPARRLYESLGWTLDRLFLHFEWLSGPLDGARGVAPPRRMRPKPRSTAGRPTRPEGPR